MFSVFSKMLLYISFKALFQKWVSKFFEMNIGIDDDVGLDETFVHAFLDLKSALSFEIMVVIKFESLGHQIPLASLIWFSKVFSFMNWCRCLLHTNSCLEVHYISELLLMWLIRRKRRSFFSLQNVAQKKMVSIRKGHFTLTPFLKWWYSTPLFCGRCTISSNFFIGGSLYFPAIYLGLGCQKRLLD